MSRFASFAAGVVCVVSLPALAVAQQAGAPGSAMADQLAESSLRMVGSMAAVLALVAVCAWLLRRFRDRQGVDNGSIEIVSGITLGSKERIVLLRVGDEQVLVGVSPAGMRSLHVVHSQSSIPTLTRKAQVQAPVADVAAAATAARADVPTAAAASRADVPAEFRLSLGAAQ